MPIEIKIVVSAQLSELEARINRGTFDEIWNAKNLGVPYAQEVVVGDPFIQCYMLRLVGDDQLEKGVLVVSEFIKEHFYAGKASLTIVPLSGITT